jgi:hypothetical protein
MQMNDIRKWRQTFARKRVRNEVSSYARNSEALLSAMPQWPGDLKKALTKLAHPLRLEIRHRLLAYR